MHACNEFMYVRSYQPCMQALHQGGYGYYVYVFLGNIMEIYIIDLYNTFLNLVFYVVRCNSYVRT